MRYRIDNIDQSYPDSTITLNFVMSGTDMSSFEFDPALAQITFNVNPADSVEATFD